MDGKTRLTHRFHAVGHKPMETLDEEEEPEHNNERNVKVVPKYRKRQERFRDKHPCLVVEPLMEAPRG